MKAEFRVPPNRVELSPVELSPVTSVQVTPGLGTSGLVVPGLVMPGLVMPGPAGPIRVTPDIRVLPAAGAGTARTTRRAIRKGSESGMA